MSSFFYFFLMKASLNGPFKGKLDKAATKSAKSSAEKVNVQFQ